MEDGECGIVDLLNWGLEVHPRRRRGRRGAHRFYYALTLRSLRLGSEPSLPPDSHVIHPHLLREGRAGIRASHEIATHCDVENDEDLFLKLRSVVNSARDVSLVILDSVQVPFDG